jgi:hypothetical protein
MRDLTLAERAFAADCAERHRIPKATVTHPPIIVPGDPFMTEKLRDPDYVPYCGPCVPMQRLRRVADGFECPTCGNKMNYDLTHFNGNVNVQYEGAAPTLSIKQWNDRVDAIKAAKRTPADKEGAKPKPLTRCAAARDGDCTHAQCPQLRDGEPRATGRHCPIDADKEGA